MATDFNLCKIAAECHCGLLTLCDRDPHYILEYNGKCWRPLIPDFNEAQFGQLLYLLEESHYKRFYLEEKQTSAEKSHLELVLCYQQSGRSHIEYDVEHENQIYDLIFKNYDKCECASNIPNSASDEQSRNLMQEFLTCTLYDELYTRHAECQSDIVGTLPQLPYNFRPTLCRFQARTVQWLLQRERDVSRFPAYYKCLQAKDGETVVYKHLLSGGFRPSEPTSIELKPGGILADEMGLGKTVEVLALIMLNPRPFPATTSTYEIAAKRMRTEEKLFCICSSQRLDNTIKCTRCSLLQHTKCVAKFDSPVDIEMYICPECWYSQTEHVPLKAQATIIATPNSIKSQWLSEIRHHISPEIRVFDYSDAVDSWISPKKLANYDVVIIDYNVMRREIFFTAEFVPKREMRKARRSMRRMTPLLMVEWWRVCLDEAQMAEGGTSKISQMTRQLPAVNRWAVTGTPIQRSIDDLRPLLQFVGFTEACEPLTGWNKLIKDFVTDHNVTEARSLHKGITLVDVLQRCMWRTCKSKVVDELKLPPQTEELHHIKLSNLEKLFYMEQHALCKSSFEEAIEKHLNSSDKILKISPRILKIVLQPLLKIRQCCIIPVISPGRQHHNPENAPQKQYLQPKELLAHLKSTNELECKAELRAMALAYNGIASIHFIAKNYDEAIKSYESVLRLASDYSVDSLLQIHALHNILQAYYTSPAQNLPKEIIAKYEQDYNALEWKYIQTYANTLAGARDAYITTCQTLNNSETGVLQFLTMLNEELIENNEQLIPLLMNKLHDDLSTIFRSNPKFEELKSNYGILYILDLWYDKLEKVQKSIEVGFENLKFFTGNVCTRSQVSPAVWREMAQFIQEVNECHLRAILENEKKKTKSKRKSTPAKKNKKLCKLCELQSALNNFECLLFNKILDKNTNKTSGTYLLSFELSLVKVFFAFLRSRAPFLQYVQQMDKHWAALECRQTLYKKLMKYWIEIEYTVKAYDELDMCKMRVSLVSFDEEKTHFNLFEYEVEESLVEQRFNLQSAQHNFALKLARLKYMKHLENDSIKEPCPICRSEDEGRYAVFECGHYICVNCLRTIKQYNYVQLTCPICRHQQSTNKIYYLSRMAPATAAHDQEIDGDFSSKIAYIVRLILRLKREHAEDVIPLKILIFSQWADILNPIALALSKNGITHRHKFSPRTIEEFKNPELGVTCLLMNLHKGSNGLNLIEATHVFLVEPILNPGEEAQAIGRVHRFGQTRPTIVHRFIVSNTIEENIYNVVSAGKKQTGSWEFKQMTVQKLRNLFHLDNDLNEEYIPLTNTS